MANNRHNNVTYIVDSLNKLSDAQVSNIYDYIKLLIRRNLDCADFDSVFSKELENLVERNVARNKRISDFKKVEKFNSKDFLIALGQHPWDIMTADLDASNAYKDFIQKHGTTQADYLRRINERQDDDAVVKSSNNPEDMQR